MTFSDLEMTGLERLGSSIMVAGLLSAAIAFAAPVAADAARVSIYSWHKQYLTRNLKCFRGDIRTMRDVGSLDVRDVRHTKARIRGNVRKLNAICAKHGMK